MTTFSITPLLPLFYLSLSFSSLCSPSHLSLSSLLPPSFLFPSPPQREAKKKQLRIWKGYTAPVTPEISAKTKNFSGKVVEIGNGDNLVVKTPDGEFQKIHFSSLRPPRLGIATCTM
jgi:hypothetical protein